MYLTLQRLPSGAYGLAGTVPTPGSLSLSRARMATARRAHAGLVMRPRVRRGVGDVVNTSVYGMAETTPVEDTASFVAYRTGLIQETNWGWTTPDAYRAAMIDLISNRCSLYTDACAGIGSNMSQWTAYVDGTLMPAYVSWYNNALAQFMQQHNGMTPDQANAAGAAATAAYNQTLNAAVVGGADIYTAQAQAQNAASAAYVPPPPANTGAGTLQVRTSSDPVPVTPPATSTALVPAAAVTTLATSAAPAAAAPAAAAAASPGTAVQDFDLNAAVNIGGLSLPVWGVAAVVLGGMWMFSGGSR